MELKQAKELAETLMKQHGLFDATVDIAGTQVPSPWSFDFDNAKTRLGICYHRQRKISLSAYVTTVNSEAQVRNTILHEIAHAVVGVSHGHDMTWWLKAKSIGCDGRRTSHIAERLPGKYAALCLGCSKEVREYYRRPKESRLAVSYHSVCGKELGRLRLIKKGA